MLYVKRILFLFYVGKDEHEVKKQEEVLQESLMMVPDCQRRLVKAYDELKLLLETESSLKEAGEYIAAEGVLEEAKKQLPAPGTLQHFC